MKHWRTLLLGLALAGGLASGCKQQLFVAEADLQRIGGDLPAAALERDPRDVIVPDLGSVRTPPSINDPDRPARYLRLEEALAIGLENGTTSSRQPGTGQADDQLVGAGASPAQSEYVRVLALNPALAKTAIENQLARFDVQWVTSMNWTTTDTLQQGLQSFQNGQNASFASSFIKALPTGGTANVSFLTDYRILTTPPSGNGGFGVLNPSYDAKLRIGFDQPLWRDYGVDINQLLSRHPQSSPFGGIPNIHQGAFGNHINSLNPFASAPEGILIARIRYDQQKADFERQMNALVLNVEVAYWKLYQAYGQLYSFEESMRIAHRAWMINKAKYDVGRIGPDEYAPFLAQFAEFRGDRVAALANVLERERNLRRLMGLPIEDGTRLVPITPPNLAQFQPNYEAAVQDALSLRPELVIARENVRVAHFNLLKEKNNLKPDLRAGATYGAGGIGTRLDGDGAFIDSTGTPRPSNAFRSLARNYFDDWSVGLILNVPLGYRGELANVRAARLSLAQNYYFLKDQEEKAQSFVQQQYQELSRWYKLIEDRRDERKAYGESLQARFKQYVAGGKPADYLLEAQRRFAAAQVKEYEAIAEYNETMARFEFSKGTILHHNNVYLSEGPLPETAQVRAVVHERELTEAHVLREKPRPLDTPARLVHFHRHDVTGQPHLINVDGPEPIEMPKKLEAAPGLPMPEGAVRDGAVLDDDPFGGAARGGKVKASRIPEAPAAPAAKASKVFAPAGPASTVSDPVPELEIPNVEIPEVRVPRYSPDVSLPAPPTVEPKLPASPELLPPPVNLPSEATPKTSATPAQPRSITLSREPVARGVNIIEGPAASPTPALAPVPSIVTPEVVRPGSSR